MQEITYKTINASIMGRLDLAKRVHDRIRDIENRPNGLQFFDCFLNDENKIEFNFKNDDFTFLIDVNMVFKAGVFIENYAGEFMTDDQFVTAEDQFSAASKEGFLSLVRHLLKSNPKVLEAIDENGTSINYQYYRI